MDQADFEAAQQIAMADPAAPGLFERITNRPDPCALRDVEQGPGDLGQDVDMLMRVDVGDVDSGALQILDLRGGLTGDVLFTNLSPQSGEEELHQRRTEGLSIGAEQGRYALRMGERCAIRQYDVATNSECGMGAGDGGGIFKGWACRHESRGRKSAGKMELRNGTVDATRETEIICIGNEAMHRVPRELYEIRPCGIA